MRYKVVLALGIVTMSTATFSTFAQPKPEDQIKFRQSGMMVMRWNMGTIKSQVVKKPQTYNKEQVIAAANVIAAIANSGMGVLFSPQTATGKGWKETRVKSGYFKQTDEVKKRSMEFIIEANQLVKIANGDDVKGIKMQFGKLLDACKACHKKFRSKN